MANSMDHMMEKITSMERQLHELAKEVADLPGKIHMRLDCHNQSRKENLVQLTIQEFTQAIIQACSQSKISLNGIHDCGENQRPVHGGKNDCNGNAVKQSTCTTCSGEISTPDNLLRIKRQDKPSQPTDPTRSLDLTKSPSNEVPMVQATNTNAILHGSSSISHDNEETHKATPENATCAKSVNINCDLANDTPKADHGCLLMIEIEIDDILSQTSDPSVDVSVTFESAESEDDMCVRQDTPRQIQGANKGNLDVSVMAKSPLSSLNEAKIGTSPNSLAKLRRTRPRSVQSISSPVEQATEDERNSQERSPSPVHRNPKRQLQTTQIHDGESNDVFDLFDDKTLLPRAKVPKSVSSAAFPSSGAMMTSTAISNAFSSTTAHTAHAASANRKFLWNDGTLHGTPEDWRCPPGTCKSMWCFWFRGDAINQIEPFRHLKPTDIKLKNSRHLLARGRYVMEELTEIAISNSLAATLDDIAVMSPVNFMAVFDKAFDILLGKSPDGHLTRPGFEMIRVEQAVYYMYGSVYEIMTKEIQPKQN
ncbi:hypothetical protein LEN26_007581 [Aphanomyces euteiches]|nr:hypothetical protein LEN26_007581 [Aphanomyces euteiches]KAH9187343.1 hypothetical protein AeNC1_010676 [Aphanomyces euteiches]